MGTPRQSNKAPKKPRAKAATPITADDFQEAADAEEDTGGKWRASDPAKSGRAFVRALDWYDKGLQRHAGNFDLAYNKARLQLEITQSPALVEHIGLPLADLLRQTLESHRRALRLNEENPDVLFNTAQVLTSLAEQLSEAEKSVEAVPLLQEALELLNACLSRQEMLYEQQQADFDGNETGEDDGGVSLQQSEPEERIPSTPGSESSGQLATVEAPVAATDLLDTAHASLSALTTLVPITDASALGRLGDMAQALTETKAPHYVSLLPTESQLQAQLALALDRANFIAALADAQFANYMIEWQTYVERLDAFNIPNGESDVRITIAEADARKELVFSGIDRFRAGSDLQSTSSAFWRQLMIAQELLSKVGKWQTVQAQAVKAQVYVLKGDLEMLRHRLVLGASGAVSDGMTRSAPTLLQNATTFYDAARKYAISLGQREVQKDAASRRAVAAKTRSLLHSDWAEERPGLSARDVEETLAGMVDEGLMEASLAQAVMQQSQ